MHWILSAAPLVAALSGITLTSFYNYLLFHSLAEAYSIIIACSIFVVAWNARRLLENHYLLFIGIAYFFVGGIGLVHTLSYKGMGIFEGYGANLPTQLWIADRYMEALSLLIGTFFLRRKLSPDLTLLAYTIATGLLLSSIFYWKIFPDCYIEGVGLTPFKIYSEYVACSILVAAIACLLKGSRYFDRKVLTLLIASLAVSIAQGIAFTAYLSVYGPSNLIGHLLKIVSFYLLYKAIVQTSLVAPWNLLFREIKQSEARLRRFRESGMIGVISFTMDGAITDANEKFLELVGYTQEDLQAGIINWTSITPSEYRRQDEHAIRELEAGGVDTAYEKEYIRKDGSRAPVIVGATATDEARREGVAFVLDITERKRLEEELRESEERLRLLGDNLPDSAVYQYTHGPDGKVRFLYFSAGIERLNGLSREEVLRDAGSLHRQIPPRYFKALVEAEAKSSREMSDFDMEVPMHRPDGRVRWMRLHSRPRRLPDGCTIWDGVQTDVTERKSAEEALRRREEEFRALVENAPDVISVFDRSLRRIYVNSQIRENTGQDDSFLTGKTLTEAGYPDSFTQPLDAALQKVFATGSAETVELDWEAPKGPIWLQIRCAPLRAADGSVERVMTIGRDITERKQMEEELRKSRDEMELRVQERTAELVLTNKALVEHAAKLERLNEELKDFAFVAAHDLQEPLRKIQTFCDMVMKRCTPALDSIGQEYLERVVSSARRMRQLLRDLLQFSNVAMKPEPWEEVDLAAVVREAAEHLKEELKESGGSLETEQMPTIEGDRAQMLCLFENLIGNALKYRSDESPQVRIYSRHDEDRWEIAVEDNGIGFDEHYVERIFRPFQRLHRQNEYSGTGMGLALCRKIVEGHGGTIRAKSEPGKGSTFIISLPAKQYVSEGIEWKRSLRERS